MSKIILILSISFVLFSCVSTKNFNEYKKKVAQDFQEIKKIKEEFKKYKEKVTQNFQQVEKIKKYSEKLQSIINSSNDNVKAWLIFEKLKAEEKLKFIEKKLKDF